MAMRKEDIEHLWHTVSRRLGSTSSSMMHQLYSLQTGAASHMDPHYAVKLFRGVHMRIATCSLQSVVHLGKGGRFGTRLHQCINGRASNLPQ
jgi:hypothetical protein